MTVRTRIAPSPTGDPHVGTAYVAVMNYCFAKQAGGEFILRIEDTDRARSTPESERVILEALRWLGITWDEGPDIGGPFGPYRQSDRSEIYRTYCDQLLRDGHAFRCFCTPARLDAMRAQQIREKRPPAYDGHCLTLTDADIAAKLAASDPFVVRMKVPREGICLVHDRLRGEISFDWSTIDMQILMKSDGLPTYHLANVVDDHLMGITHVLRGEEWVSSAPKHVLLYRYFGWQMPELCHLPLLRNLDKSKLSKRKSPTSILFYKRMGYLPEALCNFLGLFAVHAVDGDELFDLRTLVEKFSLDHISLGGPVFDVTKLDWLNGRYIREKLDVEGFGNAVRSWAMNEPYLRAIAPLAQSRIERLSDLGPLLSFLFAGRVKVTADELIGGKLDNVTTRKILALAMWDLDRLAAWEISAIETVLRSVGERADVKFRDLVRPVYVAITGSPTSVPLFDSMQLLGRDLCRERFRVAIAELGGVTKAETAAWQAEATAEVPV
jgi:glutamyl-tRNA synthetase